MRNFSGSLPRPDVTYSGASAPERARRRAGGFLHFVYRSIPALPQLAWCARVDAGHDAILVLHGSGVEAHPAGFVEGAWNDSFAGLDLARATIVAGTGAVLEGNHIRFSASTDQCGPLFSIASDGSVFVSNSPAFVLAAADEAPEDIYPFYPYDLLRIYRQGLNCPHGQLRLQSAVPLRVHYTTLMSVDRQGAISFDVHRLCERPRDYGSYRELLLDGVRRVAANAMDPARSRRYRPIAALSRGYDSTAAAVLAQSAGCTEALTFVDTRHEDPSLDNGADNARCLGMRCAVYGRWQYRDLPRATEAEFGYVSAASSAPLAAAEDQLTGRLLIGGEFGDAVWDPREADACDGWFRPTLGYTMGLSPIEFRLRVGYCMFAPACIGARHNRAIHAIALSEEMRPWSIGGDYDRPIPRRIAEEAGLARERFGMRKLASSHSHLIYPGRFSERALADYRDFVDRRHAAIPRDIYHYWRARAERRHRVWDAMDAQERREAGAGLHASSTPIRVPWNFMFTFQWTVASMRSRYAPAGSAERGSWDLGTAAS